MEKTGRTVSDPLVGRGEEAKFSHGVRGRGGDADENVGINYSEQKPPFEPVGRCDQMRCRPVKRRREIAFERKGQARRMQSKGRPKKDDVCLRFLFNRSRS
jgi:hypothetical protein